MSCVCECVVLMLCVSLSCVWVKELCVSVMSELCVSELCVSVSELCV